MEVKGKLQFREESEEAVLIDQWLLIPFVLQFLWSAKSEEATMGRAI